MVRLLRSLRGRCKACGQRVEDTDDAYSRVADINERAERLTATLGRRPLAQTCRQCGQIVFEDEPGFVQRYLLVDVV